MSVLTPEDQASFLSQAKEDAFIRYNEEGNFDPRITKPSDLPNSDPYVQDELAHQTPNLDKNFLQKRSVTATQGDLKKFNSDLRAQEIKFAAELATAGAAAYGELRAIESMFENGYSFKLLAGALAAAGTVWASLHFAHSMLTANFSPIMNLIQGLHFKLPLIGTINYGKALGSALKFTTGNYGTAGIIGGMALIGWLLRNKTDEAQAAAENLNAQVNPMVWNPNGAVVFLTAGLTMASMGMDDGQGFLDNPVD